MQVQTSTSPFLDMFSIAPLPERWKAQSRIFIQMKMPNHGVDNSVYICVCTLEEKERAFAALSKRGDQNIYCMQVYYRSLAGWDTPLTIPHRVTIIAVIVI